MVPVLSKDFELPERIQFRVLDGGLRWWWTVHLSSLGSRQNQKVLELVSLRAPGVWTSLISDCFVRTEVFSLNPYASGVMLSKQLSSL